MADPVEIALPAYFGEVRDLITAVDTENPDAKAVAKLKKWLDKTPEAWTAVGNVNRLVQHRLIERVQGSKLGELSLTKGTEVVRDGMGYQAAPQLERLLIDHLVTCWLRMQDVEWRYSDVLSGSITFQKADYWERRLSAAQRRYLRACETLARVRKLIRRTPALQVNIAMDGGQQVNVAGEMEVKRGGDGE